MPTFQRSKISAAYRDFTREINRLKRFDNQNQQNFAAGRLTNSQVELLVESIFFACFRKYENFIREIFILYTMGKRPRNNARVTSYLNPKNFLHAEQLMKSSMNFLDWNSPDTIIERSDLYLANGFPIRLSYTTNLNAFRQYKKLRNHIAHDSLESFDEYKKIVNAYYGGIAPLSYPSPGQFLILPSNITAGNYLLLDFFDLINTVSFDMT